MIAIAIIYSTFFLYSSALPLESITKDATGVWYLAGCEGKEFGENSTQEFPKIPVTYDYVHTSHGKELHWQAYGQYSAKMSGHFIQSANHFDADCSIDMVATNQEEISMQRFVKKYCGKVTHIRMLDRDEMTIDVLGGMACHMKRLV